MELDQRKRDRLLSRGEVENLIAEGNLIVIYHDKALRLNNWIARHPGGDKAVLHMVGRDASDEMDVYHSDETLSRLGVFQVGTIKQPWINFTPPIQGGYFRKSCEQQVDEGVSMLSDVETGSTLGPEEPGTPLDPEKKVIHDYDQARVREDLEKYPPLDLATQEKIRDEFRTLHHELRERGFFQCNYWGYVREFSRISFLFYMSSVLFKWRDQSQWWLFLSAVLLGLGWHQLVFIAHDAGHMAITHDYHIDNIFGVLVADFIGGLSIGWWKRNHNVHHFVTNDPEHDPDIQHLPFFAVSTRLLGSLRSTYYDRVLKYDAFAKVLLRIQHYTYYPILCFGRFNLYRLSWEYTLLGQGPRRGKAAYLRYLELAGLAFFQYWYFYLVVACALKTARERWMFVMVSHIVTMPVHVQITLSHFAMSTSNLGMAESFAQRQLRTTMDVDCPAWFDYVHGGLQFQVIHHLFPRMPRHNFRAAQKEIIKFADKVGLEYCIYGFTKGNRLVISRLGDIAQQVRILAQANKVCKQEMIEEFYGDGGVETADSKATDDDGVLINAVTGQPVKQQ
uniref:Delta 8-(E)-sphingolipid desaturase n=1 Tax=Blastobotrys adeninivorans TaxID=409370 RepID=A0A060T2N5_BLAAD